MPKVKPAPGERIRKLREAKGLTVYRLALEAKMHTGALARVERGEVSVTVPTAKKLAPVLGVRPEELLDL